MRWVGCRVVPVVWGWLWVGVCACWCVAAGVVWVVDAVLVVVDVVSWVCWDVVGGVVVGSIVVGGSWSSGGVVWGVWSIVGGSVDVVWYGGVVGGVLLRLLLLSKFPNLAVPAFYLTKCDFRLLTPGPVG